MATATRRRGALTEAEREQRRNAQRELAQESVAALLTSEGWQRWVLTRSRFHRYSAYNSMLIALQFPEATHIASFNLWRQKFYRQVRKGERSIRIYAPMRVKDRTSPDPEAKRMLFKLVPVFDVSQTEQIPGMPVVDLEPPRQPITGDSHEHLIQPLISWAGKELGYRVEFRDLSKSSAGGWCSPTEKLIVVDESEPANARLRVLVHECAHALGIGYKDYGRADAEVMVDTATLIVCSSVGLDTSGETIPYVAGWGGTDAPERIEKYAKAIDDVARQLEGVLIAKPKEDSDAGDGD